MYYIIVLKLEYPADGVLLEYMYMYVSILHMNSVMHCESQVEAVLGPKTEEDLKPNKGKVRDMM